MEHFSTTSLFPLTLGRQPVLASFSPERAVNDNLGDNYTRYRGPIMQLHTV